MKPGKSSPSARDPSVNNEAKVGNTYNLKQLTSITPIINIERPKVTVQSLRYLDQFMSTSVTQKLELIGINSILARSSRNPNDRLLHLYNKNKINFFNFPISKSPSTIIYKNTQEYGENLQTFYCRCIASVRKIRTLKNEMTKSAIRDNFVSMMKDPIRKE